MLLSGMCCWEISLRQDGCWESMMRGEASVPGRMYMFKALLASILIIGHRHSAGMSAADRVRQQYEEMRELQTLLYALRSEILYARACLGEAFLKIGRDAGEPYRGWMMEMSRKMERRQDRMLSVIWKTGSGMR